MRRTVCSGCGYDDLQTFLDLGLSPIADAYTDTPDARSERYPLQLAVCTGCWLVQLLEVVDQKTLFGTGYSFYSSASPPLSAYHERYARDIIERHGDLVTRGVVEIGCNDGDMLRHFEGETGTGCLVGVDPSGGPVEVALDRGLGVINEAFTTLVAERIGSDYGLMGVIIANHVLAHVESVSEVLRGVADLLAPDGVAYVEVQYLPDLLVNNAFDLVYHEHRNFFSLSSLEKAALRWGLHVAHAELTDRQGGSLRVMLRRTRGATSASVDTVRASEAWLHRVGAYEGVQGRAERVARRLRETLEVEINRGARVLGFGAPAKATTLLNFCGLNSQWFDTIVDTTVAKQGRYVPGTGILIAAPGDVDVRSYDVGLLTAWNYAGVIMRNNRSFAGRWVVPIPAPVTL